MYLDVRVSVFLRRVDAFPERVQSLLPLLRWLHASYVIVSGCHGTTVKRCLVCTTRFKHSGRSPPGL